MDIYGYRANKSMDYPLDIGCGCAAKIHGYPSNAITSSIAEVDFWVDALEKKRLALPINKSNEVAYGFYVGLA